MRSTTSLLAALLTLSASGCADEEFRVEPSGDAGLDSVAPADATGADASPADTAVAPDAPSADAACSTPCRPGFVCVGGLCEPTGIWSLYVKSATIMGDHKWDDSPILGAWQPDPVVCASCTSGGFKERCTPAKNDTTMPTWTTTSYGHLMGSAEASVLQAGINITLWDDDGGAREIMCTATVAPSRDDFLKPSALGGLRVTCPLGLAKDSYVDVFLRPGG